MSVSYKEVSQCIALLVSSFLYRNRYSGNPYQHHEQFHSQVPALGAQALPH